MKICFAHRTFKWNNEAKGNAAVHCVIIGFANFETIEKTIFDYQDIKGEPQAIKAKNINPYLVDSNDIIIQNRSNPISDVSSMRFGSMPRDGGNFIFTEEEKQLFLETEPDAIKFMRPFIGSQEFINGDYRWCLWLKDASPAE